MISLLPLFRSRVARVALEAAADRSCGPQQKKLLEASSVLSTHTWFFFFFSFQLVFRVVSIIFFLIVDVCLFLYRQACRY